MLRIHVDPNLGAALSALKAAESGTQDAMMRSADERITGTWEATLHAAASTAGQDKLIATDAFAEVSRLGFTVYAGVGPSLSGGLGSKDHDWVSEEFGMTPKQITAPHRRKQLRVGPGRTLNSVTTIWVGKNLPERNSKGYVAMPTARTQIPTYVAAWVYGLIGQFDGVDGTALTIQGR